MSFRCAGKKWLLYILVWSLGFRIQNAPPLSVDECFAFIETPKKPYLDVTGDRDSFKNQILSLLLTEDKKRLIIKN